MAYYTIDTNRRYVQSIGVAYMTNQPIQVDPHAIEDAYTYDLPVPGPGKGYITFGEDGVDGAEDADVILHEYGHAIQDSEAPGLYAYQNGCSYESGAMAEGFADYWAASNTKEISETNGFSEGAACVSEWVSTPNASCTRRVDGTKHYPEDLAIPRECHADGEIWSSVLWELLNKLGKQNADKLILRSHERMKTAIIGTLGGKPTFRRGGRALLLADRYLYINGAFANKHKAVICAALGKRGIPVVSTNPELNCPPPT